MNNENKRIHQSDTLDIREIGTPIDGRAQYSDRRLYFQLHVIENYRNDSAKIIEILNRSCLNSVLYDSLNNPNAIGILFIAENPSDLINESINLIDCSENLSYRSDMTMIGRTYSSGREPDLEEWLIKKPMSNVLNPNFTWAIWYPLRRKPEFYQLEPRERGRILGEHAMLGRSYAEGGFAKDIRLACFGLDTCDNEFVIGLVGSELYPLTRLIQDMRSTEQTTKYIDSLGPFFIGKVRKQFTK
ncbi:chlorite dismutase family protein [Candidatus Poribacteria bacterium]|nr:chlorite dismutase family protein [Candidatus Poribacteria bacterium]